MTVNEGPPSITLDELKDSLELRRVFFFEVSSRRWNSDPETQEYPPEKEDTQLRVLHKVEESKIAVRCRMIFRTPEGQLIADAAAVFEAIETLEEPREISPSSSLLREFAQEVGVPTIYPFLREAIHEGARKVRMKAPLLGVLRPGKIKLEPAKDEEE